MIRNALLLTLLLLPTTYSAAQPAEERTPLTMETQLSDETRVEIRLEPTPASQLRNYSPENLNRDPVINDFLSRLKEQISKGKNYVPTQALQSAYMTGQKFLIKTFPAEVLAFYTAQFMTHVRKLTVTYGSEIDDPGALNAFIDHLLTPSGYVGFLGFMVGNHSASAALNQLFDLAGKGGPTVGRFLGQYGINAAQPHPALASTYRLFRGLLINSLSMSVGMAVSSIIEEFWHDEDIWKCSELTLAQNKVERDMIKHCQSAYEKWILSHKLWEWTPHATSLVVSATLSHAAVAMVKKASGGLVRATLKGINVFFSTALKIPKVSPMGLALGVGSKLVSIYAFLETAGVFDHLIVRPWQISRHSDRLVRNLEQLEAQLATIHAQDWNPGQVKEMDASCKQGSVWSIVKNFFSERCQHDGGDFLAVLKRYSTRLTEFRRFQLAPFMAAARSWGQYIHEFVTVGTGATKLHLSLGQLLHLEKQLIKAGKGDFGLTPLTRPDFFNGIPDAEESDARINANALAGLEHIRGKLPAVQAYIAQLLNVSGGDRQGIFNAVGADGSGLFIHSPEKIAAAIWQLLLAADSNQKLDDIPVVKRLARDKAIPQPITDSEALRLKLVTEGLRLLRQSLEANHIVIQYPGYERILLPKEHYQYQMLHQFAVLDHNGDVLKKHQSEKGRESLTRHPFYRIYSILEKPWPLEPGEAFAATIRPLIDRDLPETKVRNYPNYWDYVHTPSLTEYLISSTVCGPKANHLEIFQRRSSWAESFFRTFSSSSSSFVNDYHAALQKGDVDKAYEIINKVKFSSDYDLWSNLISNLFGLRALFVPPQLIAGPKADDRVCKYLPNRQHVAFSMKMPRPHQIVTESADRKTRYYGLLDLLRNETLPQLTQSPDSLANWWQKQILPGFNAHYRHLRERYENLVSEHFSKSYESNQYYTLKNNEHGEKVVASSMGRPAQASQPGSAVIAVGIENSLKEEMAFYLKTLALLASSKTKDHESSEAYDFFVTLRQQLEIDFSLQLELVKRKKAELRQIEETDQRIWANLHTLIGFFHPESEDALQNAQDVRAHLEHNPSAIVKTLQHYEKLNGTSYKKRTISFILDRIFELTLQARSYQELIRLFASE